ncbi:exonuclease domain-containing protein [Paenibacillus sp. 481]|uniref:exonuclease domain-containing protein n=1 Tax=Paenibacillus sp. 481 TaxID=2835869 RepID=UPI001E57E15C|nr:exonuclease domain-containing protein [Paenibacillus sp. 481]UHA72610.1 3'-5' exoribonuclease [Paenibacillus sp. 481]
MDNKRESKGWLERWRQRQKGFQLGQQMQLDREAITDRMERAELQVARPELLTGGQRIAYERSLNRKQRQQRSLDVLDIPLEQLNVSVFDLETTGFDPTRGDEIIAFGVQHVAGVEIAEGMGAQFYAEVNPGMKIPTHIQQLTGITDEAVHGAPSVNEGLGQFFHFVGDRVLVAHASAHDKAFLRMALWRAVKKPFKHRIIDTMVVARWLHPRLPAYTLDHLAAHYGIAVERRHHALCDAQVTAQLWTCLVKEAAERRVTTLGDMYMYLSRN